MDAPKHPAPFSAALYPIFADAIDTCDPPLEKRMDGSVVLRVLDPFAGVGGVHRLTEFTRTPLETCGVELAPKWAATHPRTYRGDATNLRFLDTKFGAVVTSPCFGNRMADHHVANDTCKTCNGLGTVTYLDGRGAVCSKCKGTGLSHRRSYAHYYGRDDQERAEFDALPNNAGTMQWGDEYRQLHAKAWTEAHRVTREHGIFVLNVKDHLRDGVWQRVPEWHVMQARVCGWSLEWTYDVKSIGFRNGAHREARAALEQVFVFRKDKREWPVEVVEP